MAGFEGKKEFTAEVQIAIPESTSIAQNRGLDEAIAYLLPLEKNCRINNDNKNLREVNLQMIRLCKNNQDWNKLNAILVLINKRSSQYKMALTAVVTETLTYLNDTPNLAVKIELIKTLKDICEGKMYVEGESAHLSFMLAKIYEVEQKNIELACDTIQDVHVETYGSLSKQEKANYILEQIRLNLLKRDYIRTAIHSRKMNLKTIEEAGFEDIKITFYKMQIEYYTLFDKNTWEIAQAYYKIAMTKGEQYRDIRIAAIQDCITFLLLSKYNNEKSDMMFRVKTLLTTSHDWKDVAVNPMHLHVLTLFTTDEIIVTPFQEQADFEKQECLSRYDYNKEAYPFFLKQLKVRIVEHNLRIVSKYYQRIRFAKLESLLNLSQEEIEYHLSDLSFSGDIHLKIDRPAKIISFEKKRMAEEILSEWSSDINKMMLLMETTCHLINRENMVHKL